MAESISPERMQRLMELSNNAMTVELGALRNPQVTTVPLSEPESFYKTTPNVERFRNNMLRRQYKIIEDNNDKLQFEKRYADADPLPEHKKRELNLEIIDAQKEIEKIKNYTEEAVAAHVKGLQLETVADIEGDFSLSGLDQARDQIVLSDSAEDTVLAHELGHGAFSEAKDFFLRKIKELGSITAAEEAVSLEYGEAISRAVAQDLRNTKTIGFPDTNEGTVQYYDNPQGDDPLNPGGGTPTFKGGATYYSPDGGFQGMDADFPKTTDPLLQKPFTDYRTGELVYHDEYKGGTEQHDEGDFETDLKKAGLMGFETLMSDLISKRKGLDRFAERQRRGLKINPLGAPKGEVLRSVRPKTRPENFAQGGPVMRGIGTLNETARNMTRGPRGIGAYQQFASGGEAMGPPPLRGPDPQGIGYFQQFANGGPVYMKEGGDQYRGLINKYSEINGVDPEIAYKMFGQESNFDNTAESPKGALGIAQVMPKTAKQPGFGIKPLEYFSSVEEGIRFGTEYLAAMLDRFNGNYDLALAGYNAGFGEVEKYGGVPPFLETQKHILKILGRFAPDAVQGKGGKEFAESLLTKMFPDVEKQRELRRRAMDEEYTTPVPDDPMQRSIRELFPNARPFERDMTVGMESEADLDEAMYAEDYLEPSQTPLTTGEELRQGFRPSFGSQSQQDDFEAMVPQKISMRDKYSTENIAADLVGGKEALEEGIGGLTRSLRPKLRPSEIEFGEDKGGVFRSLMPKYRPLKRYPGSNPEGLFRGFQDLDLLLRKGVEQPATDIRGEPA